jgi:hypothetical protein
MLRAALLLVILAGAGCAAPFDALKPEVRAGKIVAHYCGSSAYRAETVIAAMDGPPLGQTGGSSSRNREVTVCIQLENGGSRPVMVNRNLVHLRCKEDSLSTNADKDDDSFIVPPGVTRQFKMSFTYGSSILSGEDAELRFEDAITIEQRPITLPALVLRRR